MIDARVLTTELNDPAAVRVTIQAAIDLAAIKGEPVYVPAGVYRIDKPLIMRSGVHLTGGGERTIIRNVRETSDRAGDTCVFLFGPYADYHASEDWYPFGTIRRNATSISIPISFSGSVDAGDIVFLKSDKRLGPKNPHRQEINEVVAIQDTQILLRYPVSQEFDESVGGALFAVSTGKRANRMGALMKIVCDARISNMALEMHGRSWSCIHFGGMFRCAFECVTFRGNQGLVGNGIARCRIQDCRFECDDKCLELAYFSHHTHVIGCEMLQSQDKAADVNGPLLLTGGGHHHVVERCYVVGKPSRITFCEGVRVEGNTFVCTAPGAKHAVQMNIGAGGLFAGNEMVVKPGVQFGASISDRPGMIVRNNTVRSSYQISTSGGNVETGIDIDGASDGLVADGNVRIA